MQLKRSAPIILAVADGPNLITFLGGLLSILACIAAMADGFALALALAMWAHVADSADGWLARHQPARALAIREIGKQMDSLADLLSSGAFPLVFLIAYSDGNVVAIVGGVCLCAAGLLRLSYFGVHGLDNGHFIGLPQPHNLLVLTGGYWSLSALGQASPGALGAMALLTAFLHVASFRFPKMSDVAIVVTVLAAIAATYLALMV
ncbi:CDP-alcohol phosphatidyltransferase family protein [Pelagibacterium sp. H642]|uniref:CDP-alcohol phosphatidyltransferase family protein n=1 Tax=Pelagibacterium sp. H642 TaxID=1881069 RepID=UPI002814EB0D|nr:CDP-alcohol phosphatidyltransferase family protein [Pelagibacterium sp. H642]WMT92544.1 CDP-alcohol phosphatidyltransferase family protein [Pelagibacterium sp. H642]